ncbi:MAG: site-specific integrase [Bacteroidales bacterium]|jgi:site-specific recombinase XerD|nr:site-specific integrase [Bacteroidales bacterium]
MRRTFKVLFFLKRDKQKANGNIPLFCRITVDGKETRFGMKADVNPKYWDVKAGKAIGRTTEATEVNRLIDDTKAVLYKVYRELQEKENDVTAEKVRNIFLGIEKHQTLLELFDQHNREYKLLVGKSIVQSTYNKYRITRDHLAAFIKEWYHLSDISLKEVNHKFICDFEIFMLSKRGCSANTLSRYMHFFKHIILLAIKYGWLSKDPFSDFKIKRPKTDRGYLTQEEIEILMNKEFEHKRLNRVRDVFIFCCFCGMSYIDVKNLCEEQIRTSFDGNLWIMGKRGKTQVNYRIPLLEIPKMILEKYKGTLPNNRLLPVTTNQNTNTYLKEIGVLCDIKKKLTFHLSRHTFATLTLSKGVSIESVSKMLGHTNIQTTQIYARITNEKIGNDMAIFAEKVKGMESKLAVNF